MNVPERQGYAVRGMEAGQVLLKRAARCRVPASRCVIRNLPPPSVTSDIVTSGFRLFSHRTHVAMSSSPTSTGLFKASQAAAL
ncbi:unnamed protein product [Lota lota]